MSAERDILRALQGVSDPEVGVNIVDLGLIYSIEIDCDQVRIVMTMTTPACPMHSYLTEEIRETILAEFEKVAEAEVRLVWEPAWVAKDDFRARKASARLAVKEERAMELVSEWLSDLRTHLDYEPTVTDVRVGVFYTAVEISGGEVGVTFTPRDLSDTVCCPKTAAGVPPAGRLGGVKAWELANYAMSPSPLRRAIGVVTLNALSAAAIARNGLPEGLVREDLDGLGAVEVAPDDAVVMVGAFIPFIKVLKGRVADRRLIDKHPGALKNDEQALWVSPERAPQVLQKASVVILSGSTLVEGGAEEPLNWSKALKSDAGLREHVVKSGLARLRLRARACASRLAFDANWPPMAEDVLPGLMPCSN